MTVFHSGKITLICGDCMEYLAGLDDKAFDLAVVDPPYGIGINVSMGRRKGDAKSNYKKFAGEDKSIPDEDYFLELERSSKNQIIWGGNYMTDFLYPSSCWLLWDKGFSEDVTFAQYEMAWTSFKSSAKKYDYNAAANKNRIHPTQKPVKLYQWIYANYAKPLTAYWIPTSAAAPVPLRRTMLALSSSASSLTRTITPQRLSGSCAKPHRRLCFELLY